RRLRPGGGAIVGNFGTYGSDLRELLRRVLLPLLMADEGRLGLLIGRNGPAFAAELEASHPGLAGRLVATGGIPLRQLSLHLQARAVLGQPYQFGVSTRRETVMAGLAHARPIATTYGNDTEPIWADAACVALAPVEDPAALVRVAEGLLADCDARSRLAD